ncbi:MAG: class I SAM-dependent methyltransferase [bacterium]|jgi:predicted methyltransferase|nr:methyltransferase domain-containing protein [Betaproteobacteria bacterium]
MILRRSFMALAAAGSTLAACAALAQTVHDHRHGFGGAHKWLKVLEDPKRDAWQRPHEVIQALSLKPDAVVADIGAGTGYFATRLAHMLPRGRVCAVDSEPDMVKHLAERATKGGLKNLQAIAAGGRVAIIDFTLESPEGPPKAARVGARQVQAEMEKAGYRLAREHGFLPNQFFLEFTPA